ncbi:GNAT family N-acetyltransferase [Bhargavaea beijingensis]|uniref:N-acetyltransferase n=1 Tax=Bhargavaea beijingensis TaxID=426756 RepID=A0ABX9ZDV2_9BACL|nr:GNAT family N-acetyltransferase [Bhargavaea beijingensis]RSK34243.1 N-acetyltransferase [Bhargavaea beijingensis]
MNWYDKLNEYFPVEEMKSKDHMETLLQEKDGVYGKDEGPCHVLMYAEFDEFLFVDYLFVSSKSRGQGLGGKLIEKLKAKNKPIILEVEPVDYEDTDTAKRLTFYARNGFSHARRIGYSRRSLATGEKTDLEILYWAPDHEGEKSVEQAIYDHMRKTYEEIHTYKDEDFYGESYEHTDDVFDFHTEESRKEDILEPFTASA